MGWFSGGVVFIVIWWIVFFMALPWGVKSPHEVGEEPGQGHADSAPVKPRLWLKAGIVTVIALVLWGVVFYVNANDLISFHSSFRK
jgi:predicted secreted protein